MSYQSAIDQLNAMVPELHTQPGHPRRKFSIDEIQVLLSVLSSPHHRFPSVLIAGTNGKGSTASTLASILTASGLRTGLYTSPHLARPNERIRVNGEDITDDLFAAHFFRVHDCALQLVREEKLAQLPSFFETLTAMAFLHFAESEVQIAVLEVGMGGRLDATNVVDPMLSIITDISLDHMEWLGPTITDIAREKAGILRFGGTLITLPQHPDANQVLGERAAELQVLGVSATPYMPPVSGIENAPYTVQALGEQIEVNSPLHGAHQNRNVALAIAAAVELAISHGLPIAADSIAGGIRRTRWPARFERLTSGGNEWILDVAHNPAGAWALRSSLSDALGSEPLPALIFACLRDKPAAEMAQILFPLFEQVIFAPIHSSRATPLSDLLAAAATTGTPAFAAVSVPQAIELAREVAGKRPIVVSGSVYLVGEVRTLFTEQSAQSAAQAVERVVQQP